MAFPEETLYGVHPVLAALESKRRRITKVLLDGRRLGPAGQRIMTLAAQQGIPVELVDGPRLYRLVGHRHHQGALAFAAAPGVQAFEDVLARLQGTTEPQTILLLDQVTDAGNFAALIRAADAFGVEIIIVPRHHSVTLTPVVAKRSAGAVDRVTVVQVVNAVRTLAALKQAGFWVYGADMAAVIPVSQVAWPERVVLVLGSEGHGLRRLVRASCDALVRIPMRPGVDSLNVAVAGAIVLASIWNGRLCLPTAPAAEWQQEQRQYVSTDACRARKANR
jgi:23S rRNA (guanosine2251-2'-O)-methyltransferase